MPSLHYQIADVFTDTPLTGNPLAVFVDAPALPDALMQAIAAELNLSETVFVRPPRVAGHAARLRIFTPREELPFAGHPTVGTAIVLAAARGWQPIQGAWSDRVLEEGVGDIPMRIRYADGRPVFAQFATARRPELGALLGETDRLASALGLEPAALLPAAARVASCGVPFLCVAIRDLASLSGAAPSPGALGALLKALHAHGIYLYCADGTGGWRTRMFAPELGVAEDPATGAAAAALAGVLAAADDAADGEGIRRCWTLIQGVEMGRPSRIEIEADAVGGETVAVRVGGAAVIVGSGSLQLPA